MVTRPPTAEELRAAMELLGAQLRERGHTAAAVLLERTRDAVDTLAVLDKLWRDLANATVPLWQLGDALTELGHPRLGARWRREGDALEALSRIALGVVQADAGGVLQGVARFHEATAPRRRRRAAPR